MSPQINNAAENLQPEEVQQSQERPRYGVKNLEATYKMKGIEIRKILRAHSIPPKTVDVPDGWPGQQRRQYWWEDGDPELYQVMQIISDFLAKKKERLQKATQPIPQPAAPVPQPEVPQQEAQ